MSNWHQNHGWQEEGVPKLTGLGVSWVWQNWTRGAGQKVPKYGWRQLWSLPNIYNHGLAADVSSQTSAASLYVTLIDDRTEPLSCNCPPWMEQTNELWLWSCCQSRPHWSISRSTGISWPLHTQCYNISLWLEFCPRTGRICRQSKCRTHFSPWMRRYSQLWIEL